MANELVIRKDTVRNFFEKKLEAIFDKMTKYQEMIFQKMIDADYDDDHDDDHNGIPTKYADVEQYHVPDMIFEGEWGYKEIVRFFPFLRNTDGMEAIKECLHFIHTKGDKYYHNYVPEINSTMLDIVKTMNPKHGDTVRWMSGIYQDYRNTSLIGFVWMKDDEFKIIPTYTEIDDYGSVPPQFVVGEQPGEFSPGYWKDVVDHNGINFLSEEIQERIRSSPLTKKVETYTLNKGNKYEKEIITETWHTYVKIGGTTYEVFLRNPEMKNLEYCNADPVSQHLEFY
jgi:hypothetical protein